MQSRRSCITMPPAKGNAVHVRELVGTGKHTQRLHTTMSSNAPASKSTIYPAVLLLTLLRLERDAWSMVK